MKTWIVAVWVVLAFDVSAQSSGVYVPFTWRGGDPFVFCTEGPTTESDNHWWKPIDPTSGTWAPTGLPYNQPNYASVAVYMAICPQGGGSRRDWTGTRPANMDPYKH